MQTAVRRGMVGFASATLVAIFGCSGSGSAPNTIEVPVKVIDGLIANALVCLDQNDNEACDDNEPASRTDADGQAKLMVNTSDVGKHAVVAMVGTDAIDADTGPVSIAFTLKAPADRPSVVTPLTSLVQTMVTTSGLSSSEAEMHVRNQVGIDVSLFDDFSANATPQHDATATLARLLVLVKQQMAAQLTAAIGTPAQDSRTIAPADLERAMQAHLLENIPAMLSVLSAPAVQNAARGAPREAQLQEHAGRLTTAAASTALTLDQVRIKVAINRQGANRDTDSTIQPTASASLSGFRFLNNRNWRVRVMAATPEQATPAADGGRKYWEMHALQSGSGDPYRWGAGDTPRNNLDLHWDGSAWTSCPVNFENTTGARDANGRSGFNYCGNFVTGFGSSVVMDISGRKMIDVYDANFATGPFRNVFIESAASVLGTATFPPGSRLGFNRGFNFASAFAYNPEVNPIKQYSPALSAGGIASTQPAGVACNSAEGPSASTNLEGVIGAMTGTPCIYARGKLVYGDRTYYSPDPADEAWANSTLSLGYRRVAPTGENWISDYYSGNVQYRFAFKATGANAVTYYSCKERFGDAAPRNCTAIGEGTYDVAVLGDARVLTLHNNPAAATGAPTVAVFVERGNRVYRGYQIKSHVGLDARLNLTATNALFGALGIPLVDPAAPLPPLDPATIPPAGETPGIMFR